MEKELNLPRESTMQRIAAALEHQSAMVEILAQDSLISVTSNWHEIQHLVREGLAPSVFSVGDQFIVEWTDTVSGAKYNVPLDVVHFGPVELADGEVVPGMYLQWHYTTPFGVQFSNNVPMRYADDVIPAGTYHFTIGSNWGSNCVAGKTYQFTLSQDVPVGGVLTGIQQAPDIAPSRWTIKTYATPNDQNVLEEVSLTEGNMGTDLGTFTGNDKNDTANACKDLYRIGYGYNNWKKSAMRQWLNSKKTKGNWWQKQSDLEYRPNELWSKDGFMCGFADDFLNAVATVKVTTMANTIIDGGAEDVTYDKFFLPSLEQEYCQKQVSGEGEVWEYWQRALELAAPQQSGSANANANHIRYAVENHNSAQSVRLRSAYRGSAISTWYVYSTGNLYYTSAWYSHRVAPACVIA